MIGRLTRLGVEQSNDPAVPSVLPREGGTIDGLATDIASGHTPYPARFQAEHAEMPGNLIEIKVVG